MRSALAFVLLTACSTPQTITATKDPTTEVVAPTTTNAIDGARTLRFAFAVSHEMSCSQSFETESTMGMYVLTLTPPHAATLVLTRVESETFGSSRFAGPGSADPPSHTERRFVTSFEGTVAQQGNELSLTLHRLAAECAGAGAKEGASCAAPLELSCKDSLASVVTFDDKGKHVSDRAIVRCTPGYGLSAKLAEGGWKGGLAFAEGGGMFLDYEEYGPMEGPPELRLMP
ncbi:MAG: hypothetical protein ABI175_23700 [Polyangiales bacterium]